MQGSAVEESAHVTAAGTRQLALLADSESVCSEYPGRGHRMVYHGVGNTRRVAMSACIMG